MVVSGVNGIPVTEKERIRYDKVMKTMPSSSQNHDCSVYRVADLIRVPMGFWVTELAQFTENAASA